MTLSGMDQEQRPLSDGPPSWSEDRERPGKISSQSPNVAAPSAAIIRIANASGFDPRALANSIPEDTLRRTRYPVIEEIQPDGKRLWTHPLYAQR